jgi:hypothetical protein
MWIEKLTYAVEFTGVVIVGCIIIIAGLSFLFMMINFSIKVFKYLIFSITKN